jgi:phage shock protein A
MPTQKLEKLLQELEQQIENEALQSEELKHRLQELKKSVESALAGKQDAEPRTLVDSAMEALEEFEDSYPTLTMTLGRIMDQLSKLGI